jgi:hypothetical protein
MTFLYLNSDKMGEGDAELGRKLMKIFLAKLAESNVQVDLVGCVNNGIYLTTEGSEVLDSLKRLEQFRSSQPQREIVDRRGWGHGSDDSGDGDGG